MCEICKHSYIFSKHQTWVTDLFKLQHFSPHSSQLGIISLCNHLTRTASSVVCLAAKHSCRFLKLQSLKGGTNSSGSRGQIIVLNWSISDNLRAVELLCYDAREKVKLMIRNRLKSYVPQCRCKEIVISFLQFYSSLFKFERTRLNWSEY